MPLIHWAVMGNDTEFRRVAQILIDSLNFNRDINVSVFETNIRGNSISVFVFILLFTFCSFGNFLD